MVCDVAWLGVRGCDTVRISAGLSTPPYHGQYAQAAPLTLTICQSYALRPTGTTVNMIPVDGAVVPEGPDEGSPLLAASAQPPLPQNTQSTASAGAKPRFSFIRTRKRKKPVKRKKVSGYTGVLTRLCLHGTRRRHPNPSEEKRPDIRIPGYLSKS